MTRRFEDMTDEELLTEYHYMRDMVDGLTQGGGIGRRDIIYMYDLKDEIIRRREGEECET